MKLPYFLVQPAITLPLLVSGLFALHAPQEWVSSTYWPTKALNFIAYIFPPISNYAERSNFPAITQAYMAFTFLLFPLHTWFTYKELSTSSKEPWFNNLWEIDSSWAFIKRMVLAMLVGLIVYFSLFVNPGYDFNLMPLNSSRAALGFGGWIVAGGIQGGGMAWLVCNCFVFIRYLNGDKK